MATFAPTISFSLEYYFVILFLFALNWRAKKQLVDNTIRHFKVAKKRFLIALYWRTFDIVKSNSFLKKNEISIKKVKSDKKCEK